MGPELPDRQRGGRNGILADALYAPRTGILQLAADKTRFGDPTNK
jgi:hypothetical protein